MVPLPRSNRASSASTFSNRLLLFVLRWPAGQATWRARVSVCPTFSLFLKRQSAGRSYISSSTGMIGDSAAILCALKKTRVIPTGTAPFLPACGLCMRGCGAEGSWLDLRATEIKRRQAPTLYRVTIFPQLVPRAKPDKWSWTSRSVFRFHRAHRTRRSQSCDRDVPRVLPHAKELAARASRN